MTNEQRLRECTCCFTGHRPEKLGQAEKEIRALLGIEILTAVNDGYVRFISGMARGAGRGTPLRMHAGAAWR